MIVRLGVLLAALLLVPSLAVAQTYTTRSGSPLPTSYTVGDVLYADTASTLAKLADVATGSILVSGGVGAAPSWSATPSVTSIVAGNGTSAARAFGFTNGLGAGMYYDQTNARIILGAGSSNDILSIDNHVLVSSGSAMKWFIAGSTGTVDLSLKRSAAKTLTIDDNAGGAITAKVIGDIQFSGTNSTAVVAGVISTTCPAVTCTAAYTWVRAISSDGSTVWFPVWK